MMHNNGNLRFGDALQSLQDLQTLSKRFEGFTRIPEGITRQFNDAFVAMRDGKESVSVLLLVQTERSLRNLLQAFFCGSPQHFEGVLGRLKKDGLEAGLYFSFQHRITKLSSYAQRPNDIDLNLAADLYVEAFTCMNQTIVEHGLRKKNPEVYELRERIKQGELKAKQMAEDRKARELRATEENFAAAKKIADLANSFGVQIQQPSSAVVQDSV